VDAFVIRHRSSGVPWRISEWCTASVINAGDGWHQHPTQALLDLYTIKTERAARGAEGFENLRVGIVGDIRHSRVARSLTEALVLLGASVLHIGPRTLMPPTPLAPSTDDLDAALADLDVVYLLRMQLERIDSAVVPTGEEYSRRFALTPDRAKRLGENVLVMHPGPMNRGVEITVDPAHVPGSVITQQVTNGIAARMAVLFDLLGGVDLDVGSAAIGSGGSGS
jgi:aspartate carbamoyltransferase catalytic subunit